MNRGEDGEISVAAGSAVRTSGNEGRVGDTDAQCGRRAHSSRGRRCEEIYAGKAIQIVARFVGGVEGIGETRCQLVETAPKARNFLIANLNQAGQASALQRAGDVLAPRQDVLHSIGAELGGERETLRSRYQRRTIRSRQRDALIGLNDLQIHESRKLPDESSLLVDERAGVSVLVLDTADLPVDAGDLSRQTIYFADRLHDIEIKVAALGLKVARGGVEVGCQVASGGQHGLPQRQVGRVGR